MTLRSMNARTLRWLHAISRPTTPEFVVKPDAVALMERFVWHHDQPYGDSSAIPTFLVS